MICGTYSLKFAKSDFKTFPRPSKFDSRDDVDFSPMRQIKDSNRCSISPCDSVCRERLLSIESSESESDPEDEL